MLKLAFWNFLEWLLLEKIGGFCLYMMTDTERWNEVRWIFGQGGSRETWTIYQSVVDGRYRMLSR